MVPKVVVAIIVAQYNHLLNELALIWLATAMANMTANIAVLTIYPRFIDIDRASPAVSPRVVAATFISQKIKVTAGTFDKASLIGSLLGAIVEYSDFRVGVIYGFTLLISKFNGILPVLQLLNYQDSC